MRSVPVSACQGNGSLFQPWGSLLPNACEEGSQDDDVAWFESHHVGSIPRSNSAKSIVDTEKCCRLERGETERRCEGHTQQINTITNRACHAEGGAGERAVVAYANFATRFYVSPEEAEFLLAAANWGHGVGDEHRMGAAAKGQAQHGRIDVHSVNNHTEPGIRAFQGSSNRTGVASAERSHGIEKMGEPGKPLGKCRLCLRISRHGMAQGNAHTGFHKLCDEAFRYLFWGKRHELDRG